MSDRRREFQWRPWPAILEALPPLAGQVVLDLGCGVGDQAAALAARGARVIGFDMSDEVLAAARSRRLTNVEFRKRTSGGRPTSGPWRTESGRASRRPI